MVIGPSPVVLTNIRRHHVLIDVRTFINDKIQAHLIDHYPDLYWMTVFTYFHEEDWPTAYIEWNGARTEVATIPSLLDNHGLVPQIDHRDDEYGLGDDDDYDEDGMRIDGAVEPHVYLYRHLPRDRVEQLKTTYELNRDFYNRIFHPHQRQQVAWIQTVPSTAVDRKGYGNLLTAGEYFAIGDKKDIVGVREETLRITLLQGEAHTFTLWLKHKLHPREEPDPFLNIPHKEYFIETRVHRFQLGYALTLFAQYRRDISRIKGMAYDLEVNVDVKIGLKMLQVTQAQDPQVHFAYVKAMVRLLKHSPNFVAHFCNRTRENYDKTVRSLVRYLEHLGVASPDWNQWQFWQQAINAADADQPLQGFHVNYHQHVFNEHEWIFLQMISVFPPIDQVAIHHFIESFVDSVTDFVFHDARVKERTAHQVYAQDSIRVQAENQNAQPPLVMGQEMAVKLDPFDVRAKIVWLLFMMPYIDQLAYQGGGGGGGAHYGGGPQYGAQPRDDRGGQDQMPPNPSQFNQGSYNPGVYYNYNY